MGRLLSGHATSAACNSVSTADTIGNSEVAAFRARRISGAEIANSDRSQRDRSPALSPDPTLMVTNSGTMAYVIDGMSNPSLTLCRGNTYTFAVNAPGHPFYIKTVQGTGTDNAYSSGVSVTGNGATGGDVVFVVPADAPDTLYYDCSVHAMMTGTIHIVN